jgi:hypothetical protein
MISLVLLTLTSYLIPHAAAARLAKGIVPQIRTKSAGRVAATALIDRPGDGDFLACGFVHIGIWGRRPSAE